MEETIHEISTAEAVRAPAEHELCAVCFGAPWCKDCRRLDMFYGKVAAEFPQVWCSHCNIDEDESLWEKLEIRHIPTVIITRNGRELGRAVETPTARQLKAFFEECLAK